MKNYLIAALICAAILVMFYVPKIFQDKELVQTIDSLNTEIQYLSDTIEIKEQEIGMYVDMIATAEQTLLENEGKIKIIRQAYEVQIQTVDSYDINQLEQFFSDRYKDTTYTK